MCLMFAIALVLMTLYAMMILFLKTAILLLPWTAPATLLGGLTSIGLMKPLNWSLSSRRIVGFATAAALTIVYGYLAVWLLPPAPPAPRPRQVGGEELIRALTELPNPDVKEEDFQSMLPFHLAICAGISACLASCFISGRWVQREAIVVAKPFLEPDPEK